MAMMDGNDDGTESHSERGLTDQPTPSHQGSPWLTADGRGDGADGRLLGEAEAVQQESKQARPRRTD